MNAAYVTRKINLSIIFIIKKIHHYSLENITVKQEYSSRREIWLKRVETMVYAPALLRAFGGKAG